MHADCTYVNEEISTSVSIWIPLIDTTINNGCLGVIEGSHLITNKIRGPGIQQNSFTQDRNWIKKYGTLLPVKAGDAIIYHHGLLHYSLANSSAESRPALNLSVAPIDSSIVHYCVPEGAEEIEKYKVDDNDFFLDYDNFQRPRHGKLLEKFPRSHVKFIDDKMQNYHQNFSILERIKRFFIS
jgi:hypothetical protein